MAGVLPRARILSFGLLMVSLTVLTLGSRGQGQPPKEDEPEEKILGANACIACHEKPSARWERQKVTDFIRLDESTIWEKRDLHGKAFEALKQPLGQQMAKVLNYDVTKAPQCLSCHSVDLEPAKKLANKTLKDF